MGDWKDRIPLQNGKNNVLKFALSAGMTHEQLLAALIDGTFADVFYNQALPGTADAGVAQIGTVANKAFFDALVEECNALSNNLSYDVKMLQLQQILEGNHPNMMGGMIEAFYTTDNLQTREKVTVTTGASGKCAFDGTTTPTSSWSYGGGERNEQQGAGNQVLIATGVQGVFKAVKVSVNFSGGELLDEYGRLIPPSVSFVTLVRPDSGSVEQDIGQIPLQSSETGWGYRFTGTGNFSNVSAGGVTEFGILLEATSYQGYYGSFGATDDPPTGDEFVRDANLPGETEFLPASQKVAVSVTFTFYEPDLPADGTVTTKSTDLIAMVGGGAVYLHHSTIPSGASLTPKIQLGDGEWTALERDAKDMNRPVTVGGRSMYETRYWLPAGMAPASAAALQVVGHRTSASHTLELYDMMFAGR